MAGKTSKASTEGSVKMVSRSDVWDIEKDAPNKKKFRELIKTVKEEERLTTGEVEVMINESKKESLYTMRVIDHFHDKIRLVERGGSNPHLLEYFGEKI